MNLRLRQVETGFVGGVEIRDVLVADGDARGNFLIEQFLHTQVTAQLCAQVVHRHFALVELFLEFLLRVGGLQLVELRFDVRIHGHQAELLGPLQHDLVVNQRAEHFQLLNESLVATGTLSGPSELRFELLVQIRVADRASVDRCRHVGGGRAVAARQQGQGE